MFPFHGGRSRRAEVIALTLASMLAGCGSRPKELKVRTVEVNVPTLLSCVPETLPPTPVYPDTDAVLKAAASGAERYRLIQAGRILRIQRAAEVEPVIEACRQVPRPP